MKLIGTTTHINDEAVDVLETALKRVKEGEIQSIALSWVEGKSIGGDYSAGENNIMLWAAIEHTARCFYEENVIG